MSALTRRRSDNPHHVTWHVYYGDVQVGTIGERAGVPVDVDQWRWSCGFYPGLHPGQRRHGTAPTFDEARAGFEVDWRSIFPEIPDGAFEEYRCDREARAEYGPFVLAARNCRPRSLHLSCAVFAASPSIATRQPKAMITAGIFMPHTPRGEGGKSKSLNPMHADRAAFRIFAHDFAISDILA